MCKTNRDDAAEATRTATHNVHISDRKVKVFASEVEESTLKQARELARMPFVWPHVALMPDAHTGLGSSVGTVFGTKRGHSRRRGRGYWVRHDWRAHAVHQG